MKIKFVFFCLLLSKVAFSEGCDTDCKHKCRPNRYMPPEPACYLACETSKKTACELLESIKREAIQKIGALVGRNPDVVKSSKEGGWTKGNCITNGASVCIAVSALYSTPICAAVGAALGTAPCLAAVLASGTAITGIACTQLCNDGNLRGSECGNP